MRTDLQRKGWSALDKNIMDIFEYLDLALEYIEEKRDEGNISDRHVRYDNKRILELKLWLRDIKPQLCAEESDEQD